MTTPETHPNATPAARGSGGALPGLHPATRRALRHAALVFAGGANAQRFADIGHAMQMAATSSGDTRASYLAMAVYLCTGVSPHRVTEEGARESVNAWVDQMTAAKSQAEPCDCSTCALGGRLACRHEGPTPEAMAFFIAWRDGGKNLGACPDWEPTW